MKVGILALAAAALFAIPAEAADTFSGRAQVVDGDTLIVEGQPARVRLFGIDAPESRQPCRNGYGLRYACGSRSADALAQIIGRNGIVACRTLDRDRYGRVVAICMKDGQDIGGKLVSEGWARDYAKYSHGRYGEREAQAKAAKRGAWAGRWQAPWKWREAQASR